MDFLPEAAGPHDPVLVTPARPAGSIRRTTSIDTTRPDGLRSDARVDARARDLRTNPDGTTEVVAEARLEATVSPMQKLLSITTTPDVPALQELVGGSVGSGFRARLNDVLSEGCEDGTPLFLLLDDLPGATLVSGYALLRAGLLDGPAPDADKPEVKARRKLDVSARGDLCAGWAHDGTMMLHIAETGRNPVPEGPPAPVLESSDDPCSWHAMAPLPQFSVRRRRRLDVILPAATDDDLRLDVHFRDSHVGEDGIEKVLHEYTITGTAQAGSEPASNRIVSVAARAQVLPWMECPGAVASAARIAGMPLAQLRPVVRKDFVGRTTCTHLNDMLRSLADIEALARELEATPS
jgi:Protein of unknown function (DUF2889)